MNRKLEKVINEQITKEYFSSYLYLSMAAYFESKNLPGMSHWMKMQVQEETLHGNKFYDYLNDRGSKVILGAIDKPQSEFSSVKDVFKKTLEHEKKVTASINNLYSVAQSINDNSAVTFLQWFITEQVEEEKNANDILARLEYIKEDSVGILMLDKELAVRAQPVINQAGV